jgi:dolichol-phosphate mannosyltransferase
MNLFDPKRVLMAPAGDDSDGAGGDDRGDDSGGKTPEEIEQDELLASTREQKTDEESQRMLQRATGLNWAYNNNYDIFLSMDGDFSHSPIDLPRLLAAAEKADVAVGSRWIAENSLPGWNIYRKFMTALGHALTTYVLGIPHDASGAFRAYRLDKIDKETLAEVESTGYSFFFESMFILKRKGYSFGEIPIVLPARTYGNSKMSLRDVWHSGFFIFQLRLKHLFAKQA